MRAVVCAEDGGCGPWCEAGTASSTQAGLGSRLRPSNPTGRPGMLAVLCCTVLPLVSLPQLASRPTRLCLPLGDGESVGRRRGAGSLAHAGLHREVVCRPQCRPVRKQEQQLHAGVWSAQVGVFRSFQVSCSMPVQGAACAARAEACGVWMHLLAHWLSSASHIDHCGIRGDWRAQHSIRHACRA